MPMLSCLFGRATPAVLAALRADDTCRERLHAFTQCEGVELAGDALAVVHLSGSVEVPWTVAQSSDWEGASPSLALAARALAEHDWLGEMQALPPPEVVLSWAEQSRTAGERLAWWWWWERGDDLYADAAWLFAPEFQTFVARATLLGADVDPIEGIVYGSDHSRTLLESDVPLEQRGRSPRASPFGMAMDHLGFEATRQFFPPTDDWHFDWSRFRRP